MMDLDSLHRAPRLSALLLAICALWAVPQSSARADDSSFAPAAVAMAAQDWDLAIVLARDAGPVAQDLVTWSRLRAGAGAFPEYAGFLLSHAHWPGLTGLRARGEESIPPGFDPAAVVAYFDGHPPQTGQGAVRLAEALGSLGRADAAQAALINAWTTLGLTDEGFTAMLAAAPDVLAPHHAARTDEMLWRGRTSDAGRLLPLLDPGQRALAEARIALIDNSADRTAKLAAVPAALASDPGLAHARFERLARNGDYSDAIVILSERSTSAEALGQPARWGNWRAMLARWTMREGRPEQAYQLASRHFMTDGEQFADLEWLAGYIALTYLSRPAEALAHFAAVEAMASGQITLARTGYWQGRALDALGRIDEADAAFARAAEHQIAFYGLLAAERLGLPLDPRLVGSEPFDWRSGTVSQNDLAQAMLLLIGAGERGSAVLFVGALARSLDDDGVGQLGALLADMNEPFFQVLAGKAAADSGVLVPSVYFPLHPLADLDLPVDPALALAIARRESEFNPVAVSPVGALGLMQLMPATAEEVARSLGLTYSQARLTSDWRFNATLGARYLADLEGMFGQSPVLVAAAYNAGPSRPRTWMSQRGDPRRPGQVMSDGMDVVDWIEHIPFTETRNYVMRVTESIPAYRARLTGEAGPVNFRALLTGAPPLVRPLARPDPNRSAALPEAARPAAATPGAATLRPQARPGG